GKAPQYVPPVATRLPPEPNTGPAAIATLPGGAACSAAGAYNSPVVAGVTVGTAEAGTPVPVKDANGYWHFKPSCYSYLDLASMAGGIANRQTGARVGPVRHFVTPTLPAASQATTLLVATVNCLTTPNRFAAPANWQQAIEANLAAAGRTEIWYYQGNPGGISNATFTITPANINCDAQMTEWTGVATASALDQVGTATAVLAASQAVSTAGAMAQGGELVITADGFNKGVAGQTFGRGAGWNALTADTANGFASEYRIDLPPGSATET